MEKKSTTKIREIFTSIQGEGPYVGQKHIFVRFCKCNLNCDFCDTDFSYQKADEYDCEKLYETLKDIDCNIISLTGGEPLMDIVFLKEFLSKYKEKLNKKIYLETNGTKFKELSEIIDFIDIISMDIKLKSATKEELRNHENEKFLEISSKKEVFIKVVFDNNIEESEILYCTNLAQKHNTTIVLQPKMPMENNLKLEEIFEKFYKNYKNILLIPQVHKFLNLA